MVKRYEGNTGRVTRIAEPGPSEPIGQAPAPAPLRVDRRPSGPAPVRNPLGSLTRFLPRGLEGLETEDLILMLILYLLYRESGDSEWLMILGGLFF